MEAKDWELISFIAGECIRLASDGLAWTTGLYESSFKFVRSLLQNRKMASETAVTDATDEFESDCEDLEDYGPDGYHPVCIGERFKNGRYEVLQKLGYGHFSTVWLAEDLHFGRKDCSPPARFKFVALKVQRSKETHSEAALDEVHLLRELKKQKANPAWKKDLERLRAMGLQGREGETHCIEMLDNFPHYGPNGKHYCSVFEIMGPNLLDVIRFFDRTHGKGLPLFLAKRIARQILVGLHFMHAYG